jgi:hypothetical protein
MHPVCNHFDSSHGIITTSFTTPGDVTGVVNCSTQSRVGWSHPSSFPASALSTQRTGFSRHSRLRGNDGTPKSRFDKAIALPTPTCRTNCCRWFQNRDWLPKDAVFSSKICNCNGACPCFGMRSTATLIVGYGMSRKRNAPINCATSVSHVRIRNCSTTITCYPLCPPAPRR